MNVKIPLVMLKIASKRGLKRIPKKPLASNMEESKMKKKRIKIVITCLFISSRCWFASHKAKGAKSKYTISVCVVAKHLWPQLAVASRGGA